MHEFKPKGVCSTKITFDLNNGKISNLSFEDGCNGNLKAISILAEGMEAGEFIEKLKGLKCGKRKTSCGDQAAEAIAGAIAQAAAAPMA